MTEILVNNWLLSKSRLVHATLIVTGDVQRSDLDALKQRVDAFAEAFDEPQSTDAVDPQAGSEA